MYKNTVLASLTVIGIAVMAHLKVFATIREFVTAKSTGNDVSLPPDHATLSQFGTWVGAYIALSFILLAGSEGEKYGDVSASFSVLLAGASFLTFYKDIQDVVTGQAISSPVGTSGRQPVGALPVGTSLSSPSPVPPGPVGPQPRPQ